MIVTCYQGKNKAFKQDPFIYINRRVLLRNQGKYVGHFDWCDLTEEERLEWEASIVENDYIERQRRTRKDD